MRAISPKTKTLPLRGPKRTKHKHFIGISLPYWASLSGGLCGISLSKFLLMCFFGALSTKLTSHRGNANYMSWQYTWSMSKKAALGFVIRGPRMFQAPSGVPRAPLLHAPPPFPPTKRSKMFFPTSLALPFCLCRCVFEDLFIYDQDDKGLRVPGCTGVRDGLILPHFSLCSTVLLC